MVPREFSRVSLLVHPFFSAILENSKSQKVRKNLSFLAGLWGKKIREAAQDPETLFIIVADGLSKKSPHREKFDALVSFARKNLGERFVLVNFLISSESLGKELRRRNFIISPKNFSGISFGEWWGECVHKEAGRLANVLGVDPKKIISRPDLSVNPPYAETPSERMAIGEITQNLRSRNAKRMRRRRKAPMGRLPRG